MRTAISMLAFYSLVFFVIFLLDPYSEVSDKPYRWKSERDCFDMHLIVAGDAIWSVEGDVIAELRQYCEWAFRSGQGTFAYFVEEVDWKYVFAGPAHQRRARMDKYFSRARR